MPTVCLAMCVFVDLLSKVVFEAMYKKKIKLKGIKIHEETRWALKYMCGG